MTPPTKPKLTTVLPHDFTHGRKLTRAEVDDLYGFDPLPDEPTVEPYPTWARMIIWIGGLTIGVLVALAAIRFFSGNW